MDTHLIVLIIIVLTIILFVPFTPFRPLKRIILLLFNRFVPLPIKFRDIGGIPVIGMRLFDVKIALGPMGRLEAEEMHLRLRFIFRILALRRPHFDPITFYRPKIYVDQTVESAAKGDVWFLFPFTAVKQVISVLFLNLTGLNVVRMYGGTMYMTGKRGETTITNLNGEFTSHGGSTKVRRLSCYVGEGNIEIQFPKKGPMHEGRLVVRNLHLEDLKALKVPKLLTGPMNIEAAMLSRRDENEITGHISSPSLFMRDVPILDFRSPLHFKDETLTLSSMSGRIGEYALGGRLTANVITDITDLYLNGGGRGSASGLILQMLSMNPFISYAELDADVHLWGDLNEFYEFGGDIKIGLKDAEIDFAHIGEGTMTNFPLEAIPNAALHMKIEKGVMKFHDSKIWRDDLVISFHGDIPMQFDEEADKVVRSQFDLKFKGECSNLQELANQFGMRNISVDGTAETEAWMYCDYEEKIIEMKGGGHFTARDARVSSLPLGKRSSLDGIVDILFDSIDMDMALETDGMFLENIELRSRLVDFDIDCYFGFLSKKMEIEGSALAAPAFLRRGRLFKMIPALEKMTKRFRPRFRISGQTGNPHFQLLLRDTLREILNIAPFDRLEDGSRETSLRKRLRGDDAEPPPDR